MSSEAADDLWRLVYRTTGVKISRNQVCPEHSSPWAFFSDLYFQRPPLSLVLGSRGAGKSFLSALHTHFVSQGNPGHATRILGGSLAQSFQVYRALSDFIRDSKGAGGAEAEIITDLLKSEARYRNGSEVSILAASSTSVRGPHVPSLKLDELDEIDPECREAAMGMCMARKGSTASVLMTSTWHRVGGPMATMMDHAQAGEFPLYTFCAFDVLEHCPDERSGCGPAFDRCPECPLNRYCSHVLDGGPPRAKRADGHYSIDSLIQKLQSTSARTFQAEYLCQGPKADGLWFPDFAPESHVTTRAEYDPAHRVYLALDSGVFTGAVFFQVARVAGQTEEIRIFCDYLAENKAGRSQRTGYPGPGPRSLQQPDRCGVDRSSGWGAQPRGADRYRRVRARRAESAPPLALGFGG